MLFLQLKMKWTANVKSAVFWRALLGLAHFLIFPYAGCLGLGIIPWSFSNFDFSSELLAVDVSGILMACTQLPLTHIRVHRDAVR